MAGRNCCAGDAAVSQEGQRVGAVVVFDDVTDLIQAQKNAAWGEVARRLAHEIKNPLTPFSYPQKGCNINYPISWSLLMLVFYSVQPGPSYSKLRR